MKLFFLSSLIMSPLLFLTAQVAKAANNQACSLLSDIRLGKVKSAEQKITRGQNPFEVCPETLITPAHFTVQKYPKTELSRLIIVDYLKRNEVDPNVMGVVDGNRGFNLPRSIEENFTLFQAVIMSGDHSGLEAFKQKNGFDPNHRGKILTAEGIGPESPLALSYFQIFKSDRDQLALLKRDEAVLRKIGATFSNCEALADIVDTDVAGTNLRGGPSGSFPVVGKILKNPMSKNRPVVIVSGYNLSGWFQVRHVFPNGYQDFSELNSCAVHTDIKGEAWVHGSLIDFRELTGERSKANQVLRNLCYGEAVVQILENNKILRHEGRALKNQLPDFGAPCNKE